MGVVALEAADGDDDDGKDHGLEEAALHVVHGDARLYAREVASLVESEQHAGRKIASEYAHDGEDGREKGKGEQRGEKSRRDEIARGIDVHDFEGVYLVGNAHDAYLRRHGGAGARRDHDGGEHGSHFADEREGQKGTEHALSAEHGHGVECLKSEDQTGEQADEQDDEHGLCPDDVYLLENLARKTTGMERLSEAFKQEQRHFSEAVQKIQDGCEDFIHDGTLLRWISRRTLADFTPFGNVCALPGHDTLA